MQEHATDPQRVHPIDGHARATSGGMALAAPEAVRILDAAGYDRVVVETVGVGQAEVDVAAATDTAVVVLAPGMGDAVQMAKAGILEVADVFVVNKADRDGAHEVVRELRQMLHLGAARDWDPPVLTATAIDDDGVEELWEAIECTSRPSGARPARSPRSAGHGCCARSRRSRPSASVSTSPRRSRPTDRSCDDLVERRIDPYEAAAMLVRTAAG